MLSSALAQPAVTEHSTSAQCCSCCSSIILGSWCPSLQEQHQQRQTGSSGHYKASGQCVKCMAWIVLWHVLSSFHCLKKVPEGGPWLSVGVRKYRLLLGAEVPVHVSVWLCAVSWHPGCTGKPDPGKQETSFRRLEKMKAWVSNWDIKSFSRMEGKQPMRQTFCTEKRIHEDGKDSQHGVSRQVDIFTP